MWTMWRMRDVAQKGVGVMQKGPREKCSHYIRAAQLN